jgi:hypothetical protein
MRPARLQHPLSRFTKMSGDSSLGIGIGLALKSYGRGLTYVKTDRALDLGNLEPFTIPDLSGNANTATLYSGIYVTTNGTTDKAIGANATALGSGNYYLSGKIKPAGTTAKTTMNGSTASNLTGLTAGVWQDFQTATASAITPSSINLGWDGTAFNATVDNWSDVKLHDASDDSVVAHYKLYDSADASLGGYPALDCVGGFHGAHVGCAGGASEASILQTAGEDFNKLIWFDGVAVDINATSILPATDDFTLTIEFFITELPASNRGLIGSTAAGVERFIINIKPTGILEFFAAGPSLAINTVNAVILNQINTVVFSKSGNNWSLSLNGEAAATSTGVVGNLNANQQIGDNYGALNFNGLITSLSIGATTWNGSQSDALANGWTVNGSPSLYHVAESETTAGQDALGNAIENPRPNERVLNLTTGTGYAEIADSASLDGYTDATWEAWVERPVTTSNSPIINKAVSTSNFAWNFYHNSGPSTFQLGTTSGGTTATRVQSFFNWAAANIPEGEVGQLVAVKTGTTVEWYWNGVLRETDLGGAVVTIANVTSPVFIGQYIGGIFANNQQGDHRIYDRALTADEVLKNYNARKSAYGL